MQQPHSSSETHATPQTQHAAACRQKPCLSLHTSAGPSLLPVVCLHKLLLQQHGVALANSQQSDSNQQAGKQSLALCPDLAGGGLSSDRPVLCV